MGCVCLGSVDDWMIGLIGMTGMIGLGLVWNFRWDGIIGMGGGGGGGSRGCTGWVIWFGFGFGWDGMGWGRWKGRGRDAFGERDGVADAFWGDARREGRGGCDGDEVR